MAAFANQFESCRVVDMNEYPLSNRYCHLRLPSKRNEEKDTHEYISMMYSKTILIKMAALWNPWSSDRFAWIDMSIFYLFKRPQEASLWLRHIDSHIQLSDRILIPGCWPKGVYSLESPAWRFCGSFFIGTWKAIVEFGTICSDHLETFLQEGVLSWEVNFWAWLEHGGFIRVDWYEADHNDSMLCSIPISFFSSPIGPERISTIQPLNPILPCKEGYRPSSISHIYHFQKHWILVRYVSYTIVDGCFVLNPLVPYSNISSLNYLASIEIHKDGIKVVEGSGAWLNTSLLNSLQEGLDRMSRGIEDVRMFSMADSGEMDVSITGTNVDMTDHGIPNCFVGKMDLMEGRVSDISIFQSKQVEKNWIPVSNKDFIYEWKRDKIVFIDTDSTTKTYISHLFPMLHGARGSSCFVEGGDGLLYGIVHKVEEQCYWHIIIVMNRNREVVRHSRPFYYKTRGIQYCIGYWFNEDLHHLFMSIEDRDPMYIQIRGNDVEWFDVIDMKPCIL